MSYTKDGYEHMGEEILKDFIKIGLFIRPGVRHYTEKSIIFKNKVVEVLSSEVNVVILTRVIDSNRHKKAAMEIIDTMMDHLMFQQWVDYEPEYLGPIVNYLEFYIETKCQGALKALLLYEKVKKTMGGEHARQRSNGTHIG